MEGECEVCGRPVKKLVQVNIEGSVMKTCFQCSRLGNRIPQVKPRVKSYHTRPPRRKPEILLEPRPGFGDLIRERREELGLTQEELGKRLNEKTSVIARLEAERMTPSEALAKKIEKHLGVKILEKVEEAVETHYRSTDEELTLGDIVKIKRKKA